jgi:hypothetical protein
LLDAAWQAEPASYSNELDNRETRTEGGASFISPLLAARRSSHVQSEVMRIKDLKKFARVNEPIAAFDDSQIETEASRGLSGFLTGIHNSSAFTDVLLL